MKFSCEKALLTSAVSTASRAVAAKSTIPAMEGILIDAGDTLKLTGYDLSIGIQSTVPAEIIEKGSLVLSARLFGDIIRKMPDDVVTFTTKDLMVNIRCGLSEFNILGTSPEDFPELPAVDQQNSFTIGQQTLRSMIGQTLFAVSDNESRPVHTGSLFEADDISLTVVSVDGYRLALRHEGVEEKKGRTILSVCGSRQRSVRGGKNLLRGGRGHRHPGRPARAVSDGPDPSGMPPAGGGIFELPQRDPPKQQHSN